MAELLDDDTEIVRHNADYALYKIGQKNPDAVAVRRAEWLSSPKPLVRARALNLFADLETENGNATGFQRSVGKFFEKRRRLLGLGAPLELEQVGRVCDKVVDRVWIHF